MSSNITWHKAAITKEDRHRLYGHKSAVLWFTGLSGAGKSTIANAVSSALYSQGIGAYVLDGDNIRHGLNKDLGFSEDDRKENIRRIGEVAKLFVDSGQFTLTAFISPFRSDREIVRNLVHPSEFIEVYVQCSLEECEKRDVKGLYEKARAGEIKDFTGIHSPYEEPFQPEITLHTATDSVERCVEKVLHYLEKQQFISKK